MAKTRLMVSDRDRICDRIMTRKRTALREALEADQKDFTMAVYETLFDVNMRKQMDDLPQGWLPRIGELRFPADEGRTSGYVTIPLPGSFPIPALRMGSTLREEDIGSELMDRWHALRRRSNEEQTMASTLKQQVSTTLFAFKYVEDLLEGWPEAEADIRASVKRTPLRQLPVITNLNALLDLPAEDQEAA